VGTGQIQISKERIRERVTRLNGKKEESRRRMCDTRQSAIHEICGRRGSWRPGAQAQKSTEITIGSACLFCAALVLKLPRFYPARGVCMNGFEISDIITVML